MYSHRGAPRHLRAASGNFGVQGHHSLTGRTGTQHFTWSTVTRAFVRYKDTKYTSVVDYVSGTLGLVVARVDLWPSQGLCKNVNSTLPLRERKCGGMRKPCEATRLVTIRAHALSHPTLPLGEAAVTTSCLRDVNGCEPVSSVTPINVGSPTSIAHPHSCLSTAATPQQKVGLPWAHWRPEGSAGYAGRCQHG